LLVGRGLLVVGGGLFEGVVRVPPDDGGWPGLDGLVVPASGWCAEECEVDRLPPGLSLLGLLECGPVEPDEVDSATVGR
jgi:hypothetical protein